MTSLPPRWLLAALSGALLALAFPGSGDQSWLACAQGRTAKRKQGLPKATFQKLVDGALAKRAAR